LAKRTIILHYHLFKNAGTSVDRILQRNFPERWVTAEFRGQNNTAQVTDWIQNEPDAVAFSSHTMMGPLPKLPGVEIIPVMMLRDPISRIRSAYRFEHAQKTDNFGAILARHTDLEGYVRVRLALPGDRQCRNFQTWRLASLVPGPEPELERATKALGQLSVAGLVSDFGGSLGRLQTVLAEVHPDFTFENLRLNVSKGKAADEDDEVSKLLRRENQDDMALLERAAALWRGTVQSE